MNVHMYMLSAYSSSNVVYIVCSHTLISIYCLLFIGTVCTVLLQVYATYSFEQYILFS
jgi:TRAP-type C4-dicarboxylate transport system permease small subunit